MTEEQQEQRVIGLDAHPYLFSVAALAGPDALRAEVKWVVDRQPLERLEEIIRKRVGVHDVVVLESSGNSFAVAEKIFRCGRTAVVLESQSVGRVGTTYCATDKIDAIKIARVYLSGLARVVWQPNEESLERRELFFAHRNAVCDSVRARNRIWAWCNGHGLRRPKDLRLARPDALQRLKGLKSDWNPVQLVLLTDMVQSFQHAEARRVRLRQMIAESVLKDPHVLKLVRVLGIRHLIAFALAAFIGPIDRFATPKKLVAYFGLNPIVNRSGIGGGNGGLSHYGRADIRALMMQAAQSVLRSGKSSPFHRWAVALKMRKGTTIAVCALARKLIVAIWYLMRGMFTPLQEVPESLHVKLQKIASDVGIKRVRDLGFRTISDLAQAKADLLLQTS